MDKTISGVKVQKSADNGIYHAELNASSVMESFRWGPTDRFYIPMVQASPSFCWSPIAYIFRVFAQSAECLQTINSNLDPKLSERMIKTALEILENLIVSISSRIQYSHSQ